MATDAERDPVEWAQHSALVAISVVRTVLDLVEAAVADRERVERLATSGRSFAEAWAGDIARLATTVVSGFGLDPEAKPAAAPAQPPPPAGERPPTPPTASRTAGPSSAKRPAKKVPPRPRAKTVPTAKKTAVKGRKGSPTRAKPRKK